MKRVLLTGAGFSKNWGGWLADEVSGRLLRTINHRPDLGSTYCDTLAEGGNYESFLQHFQRLQEANPTQHEAPLRFLEDAIRSCFAEMDRIYDGKSAGLSNDATYNAEVFLAHFDTFFTTNQDCLVERLFANLFSPGMAFTRTDRSYRRGVELPGVVGTPTEHRPPSRHNVTTYTVPDTPYNFGSSAEHYLQYVKLHGSYNWNTEVLKHLMISGGDKGNQITRSPLLKSYFDYFSRVTKEPNTHITVIGYGFNDIHINTALVDARKSGATLSVLDPKGISVTMKKPFGDGLPETDLFKALRGSLSEISRNSLTDLFADSRQAEQLFQDTFDLKQHQG